MGTGGERKNDLEGKGRSLRCAYLFNFAVLGARVSISRIWKKKQKMVVAHIHLETEHTRRRGHCPSLANSDYRFIFRHFSTQSHVVLWTTRYCMCSALCLIIVPSFYFFLCGVSGNTLTSPKLTQCVHWVLWYSEHPELDQQIKF